MYKTYVQSRQHPSLEKKPQIPTLNQEANCNRNWLEKEKSLFHGRVFLDTCISYSPGQAPCPRAVDQYIDRRHLGSRWVLLFWYFVSSILFLFVFVLIFVLIWFFVLFLGFFVLEIEYSIGWVGMWRWSGIVGIGEILWIKYIVWKAF